MSEVVICRDDYVQTEQDVADEKSMDWLPFGANFWHNTRISILPPTPSMMGGRSEDCDLYPPLIGLISLLWQIKSAALAIQKCCFGKSTAWLWHLKAVQSGVRNWKNSVTFWKKRAFFQKKWCFCEKLNEKNCILVVVFKIFLLNLHQINQELLKTYRYEEAVCHVFHADIGRLIGDGRPLD